MPLERVGPINYLSSVVAIFREPDQRLLSSYYWIKKSAGVCCYHDWGWAHETGELGPGKGTGVRESIVSGADPSALADYGGCMTSMILGFGCMSKRIHTRDDIAAAIDRMSKFKFVGLQSKWRLSCCLFNKLQINHPNCNYVIFTDLVEVRCCVCWWAGGGGVGGWVSVAVWWWGGGKWYRCRRWGVGVGGAVGGWWRFWGGWAFGVVCGFWCCWVATPWTASQHTQNPYKKHNTLSESRRWKGIGSGDGSGSGRGRGRG